MLTVDTIGRIRWEHFLKDKSIKEIVAGLAEHRSRSALLGRDVVRVCAGGPAPAEARSPGGVLEELLASSAAKSAREQFMLIRIYEELRGLGYDGGYDAVRRYACCEAKDRGLAEAVAVAYVPLSFAPVEAYQFNWSHEIGLLNGVTTAVKVARDCQESCV